MEDGRDHQDGGETGSGSAAMPPVEPMWEPAVEAADSSDQSSGDPDDSLTGVLAALGESDSDESPAFDENPIVDVGAAESVPEPLVDAELAALQAELEADAVVSETAELTPVPPPDDVADIPAEDNVAVAVVPPEAPAAAVAGGVQAASADSGMLASPEDHAGVPIWPFLAYFGLWVVFTGLLVWQFLQTPAGEPLYELAIYGPSIFAGLVLTALGPVLAIGVWVMLWMARPTGRTGLFSRSLILGAVVTLAGVALWLVALGAVDMLRLGRLI